MFCMKTTHRESAQLGEVKPGSNYCRSTPQTVCSSAEQSCQCTDGCTDGGKLQLSLEIAADIFSPLSPADVCLLEVNEFNFTVPHNYLLVGRG